MDGLNPLYKMSSDCYPLPMATHSPWVLTNRERFAAQCQRSHIRFLESQALLRSVNILQAETNKRAAMCGISRQYAESHANVLNLTSMCGISRPVILRFQTSICRESRWIEPESRPSAQTGREKAETCAAILKIRAPGYRGRSETPESRRRPIST